MVWTTAQPHGVAKVYRSTSGGHPVYRSMHAEIYWSMAGSCLSDIYFLICKDVLQEISISNLLSPILFVVCLRFGHFGKVFMRHCACAEKSIKHWGPQRGWAECLLPFASQYIMKWNNNLFHEIDYKSLSIALSPVWRHKHVVFVFLAFAYLLLRECFKRKFRTNVNKNLR